MYSALAGFVEPGESLEDCVRRETLEEVGLEVGELTYFRSQGWPFPRSLMIGFEARATSDAFRLDDPEIEEARWFSREELRAPKGFFYPPPMSLAHHLVQRFLRHPDFLAGVGAVLSRESTRPTWSEPPSSAAYPPLPPCINRAPPYGPC